MKKISVTQKKWLLSLHILFSAILFGAMLGFLILSMTAMVTKSEDMLKACYTVMLLLTNTTVRASTIGTVVTGILLSLLTNWGFLKFYWIIVKEVLTLLCIGLGIIGMNFWSLKAVNIVTEEGSGALQNLAFTLNSHQLMVGIILQIVSLAAMFIISVFKPWGQRKTA